MTLKKELDSAIMRALPKITLVANKRNPAFNNAPYADLNQTHDAILDVLATEGVRVLHQGVPGGIKTTLRHIETGQEESSVFVWDKEVYGGWKNVGTYKDANYKFAPFFESTPTMHHVGGMFTYGARYNLRALLCLQQEDDDGNKASHVGSDYSVTDDSSLPW